MNKLRIASAIAALTSALALPAWGADPTTNNGAANLDQQVPSSATQQSTAATSAATGDLKDSKAAAKARKQTPTAAMDSATPADKSTMGNSATTKHPPTTEMDRATPDQKGSAATDTPAASAAPASPARN